MQKIPLARTFSSIIKGKNARLWVAWEQLNILATWGFMRMCFLIPGVVGEVCPSLNLLPFFVLCCNAPEKSPSPCENCVQQTSPLLLVSSVCNQVQLKRSRKG